MRRSAAQSVIVIGLLAVATGCSTDPEPAARGSEISEISEITEQELCELVPPADVSRAFSIRVESGEPERSTDEFLGKSVLLTCSYFNTDVSSRRGYVTTSVKYHYNKSPLEEYAALGMSDEVPSEPIDGLADKAAFYPEGSDPEPITEESEVVALTQLDGAIRTVTVSVNDGGERSELEPVLTELLAALDA